LLSTCSLRRRRQQPDSQQQPVLRTADRPQHQEPCPGDDRQWQSDLRWSRQCLARLQRRTQQLSHRRVQWRGSRDLEQSDHPGSHIQNYKLVDYGAEGLVYVNNNLLVSDNNFISTGTPNAIGIYDPNCVTAQLSGNTFSGITTIVDPPNCAVYLDSSPPT